MMGGEMFHKMRLRFFSLAGKAFNDQLNGILEQYKTPDPLFGPPIFRNFEFNKEFCSQIKSWAESGDVMVLVGDLGGRKSQFIDELVYRSLVLVSSDGSSGCSFVDKHRSRGEVFYMGLQRHLMNGVEEEIKYKNSMRLGQIRSALPEAEPAIRDAEACIFGMSAMRKSDVPGKRHPGISGLFMEEACQLSRYFGIADQSSVLWINGFKENGKDLVDSADAVAQLVWYFLDGVASRKSDYPIERSQLVEYSISGVHDLDSVVFYKSKLSGRWWFSLSEEYNPLTLHACSFKDYQMLCNGEVSDRLFRFLEE